MISVGNKSEQEEKLCYNLLKVITNKKLTMTWFTKCEYKYKINYILIYSKGIQIYNNNLILTDLYNNNWGGT